MLGELIDDPLGIEDIAGCSKGLGLLPITTVLTVSKTLTQVRGHLRLQHQRAEFSGYEIHCGECSLTQSDVTQPLSIEQDAQQTMPITKLDGMVSNDQQILATYVHGLFVDPAACQLILQWAGLASHHAIDINQIREQQLNRLADVLEAHLDMNTLKGLIS
ncbi:MAG: adenosylcobyric acid synthase [Shewanella psychromarinicola]|jgi:adenosylcobyric acid synthase